MNMFFGSSMQTFAGGHDPNSCITCGSLLSGFTGGCDPIMMDSSTCGNSCVGGCTNSCFVEGCTVLCKMAGANACPQTCGTNCVASCHVGSSGV